MPKILIVDDNDDNREIVRKVLKLKGYEIIEASTGEDAVKNALKENPDLILMDINLPDIDGYSATKRIKERMNVPIIALTAYALKGDSEKAIAAGCDGYISKPVDLRELPLTIEKFLKNGRIG